jgi:glucokinase
MNAWTLGGDLGGTKMAAALIDADGRILVRKTLPTQSADGIERVTGRFSELLCEVAGEGGEARPVACGVAAPGLVDPVAGEIRYAANLPGADHFPLRQRLQAALSLPVAVDNDLRVHALGESHYGSGRGCRDFLFVAVGTGVGGALVLDGRLYPGSRSSAGEIGHIPIDDRPEALVCGCGRRGCLEAYASGPAIAVHFQRRALKVGLALETPAPSLKELAQWLDDPGDRGELAREAVAYGARALGRGLGIAANLLDPQRIILGGGVSRLGAAWLRAVRRSMDAITLNRLEESDLQLSNLGEDAALLGAGVLARQK